MMMHMWFWFGTDLRPFLLPGYNVTTTWGLIATCLGLIALAIIYEAMKMVQIKLHHMNKAAIALKGSGANENSSLLHHLVHVGLTDRGSRCRTLCRWLMEVFHYAAHATLGYVMMLAVMTYNGYICLALLVGAAVGYHIFGPTLIALNLAEVRRRYEVIPCDLDCAGTATEILDGSEGPSQSTISVMAEPVISTEVPIQNQINADVHVHNTD